MTPQPISKFRLALNGIGTFLLAALCLPVAIPGLIGLLSGTLHFGTDPDGADKVLGIQLFSGLIGALALISFVRTLIAWRRVREHRRPAMG